MSISHSMKAVQTWEKQLQSLGWIVHYIFVAPLVVVGTTFFLYRPDPTRWHLTYEPLFYGLAVLGFLTFPLMAWFHRQLISLESLEMRKQGLGVEASFPAFRIGMILSAAMGEICAFLGIFFYLITRNAQYSALFFGQWGLHYVLASVWLRRAYDDFTLLTRDMPSTATDSTKQQDSKGSPPERQLPHSSNR